MRKAEEITEAPRQEPYRLLTNDCITKSVRFKRRCRAEGISARVVLCMGPARARWFGLRENRLTPQVLAGHHDCRQ